jgi:hypothetical protein
MAFTEASLNAQIDSATTGKVAQIITFNPGSTYTDIYVVGITAPYAGRSRWTQVANSNTAAQAWTAIQNNLA